MTPGVSCSVWLTSVFVLVLLPAEDTGDVAGLPGLVITVLLEMAVILQRPRDSNTGYYVLIKTALEGWRVALWVTPASTQEPLVL